MRRTAGREFSKAIGACNGDEYNFSKIESAEVGEEELTRRLVLGRIKKRFGAVPEGVQAKVQAMDAVKPLAEVLEKLPLLRSAEDLLSRRRVRSENQA